MGNTELRRLEGTQDVYVVSSLGNVYKKLKNKPRANQSLSNKLELEDGWYIQLKPYARSKGYLCVEIDKVAKSVHRLVALCFIPNPEAKPQVNHKDGDKTNNAVSNLEWATNRENSLHAIHELGRKPSYGGRNRKGVENRLTAELYDRVQRLLETTTLSKADIGLACGCSYSVVKRCHYSRKVQRPSEYDYRKTRSLGVGNSVSEAPRIER